MLAPTRVCPGPMLMRKASEESPGVHTEPLKVLLPTSLWPRRVEDNAAVDRMVTSLMMTFPNCLEKTIESVRKHKLEHWDRNRESKSHVAHL